MEVFCTGCQKMDFHRIACFQDAVKLTGEETEWKVQVGLIYPITASCFGQHPANGCCTSQTILHKGWEGVSEQTNRINRELHCGAAYTDAVQMAFLISCDHSEILAQLPQLLTAQSYTTMPMLLMVPSEMPLKVHKLRASHLMIYNKFGVRPPFQIVVFVDACGRFNSGGHWGVIIK